MRGEGQELPGVGALAIACFLVTSAHLPVRCIVGFSAISLP